MKDRASLRNLAEWGLEIALIPWRFKRDQTERALLMLGKPVWERPFCQNFLILQYYFVFGISHHTIETQRKG